jgi:hypothetical protein
MSVPPFSRCGVSGLLKKSATGFASAELPQIFRHWQSQWHSKDSAKTLFQRAVKSAGLTNTIIEYIVAAA